MWATQFHIVGVSPWTPWTGREGRSSVTSIRHRDRPAPRDQRRHPGGRPRRGPADPRGRGRRAGHLRRAAAEASGLARSTTSRLLAALERTRLLERSGTGEYVGGPLFVLYAARHDRNEQLARLRPRCSRRSASAPARPCTSPSPTAAGRAHRPGRLHLPARRARLDRHRGPAALLGARQGAAGLGRARPASRSAGGADRAQPAHPR